MTSSFEKLSGKTKSHSPRMRLEHKEEMEKRKTNEDRGRYVDNKGHDRGEVNAFCGKQPHFPLNYGKELPECEIV